MTADKPRADSPQRLARDERGAIVLMAVFMSAFMVGGLWYIMGIGDAKMQLDLMGVANWDEIVEMVAAAVDERAEDSVAPQRGHHLVERKALGDAARHNARSPRLA